MTIYTRKGDEGYTSGPGGQRIPKRDPRLSLLGSVDELNSNIGWCLAAAADEPQAEVREGLEPLQPELLVIGAMLAATGTDEKPNGALDETPVERMERQIDSAWEKMPELTHFIIPGGCELGCRLHVARTVCRRTERALARAAEIETRYPPAVFKYLNRLGDLLFALARLANHCAGCQDVVWEGRPE